MKEKLLALIRDPKRCDLMQFVKFGLVGASNTAISYGIEMLCYYALFANVKWPEQIKIVIISQLAFTVSVVNSYYWNNRVTFKSTARKTTKQHLVAFLKTVLCYGVTGLILAPMLKIWISNCGIAYWLASLISLIITIPLNFVLNKYWAFRDRTIRKDGE